MNNIKFYRTKACKTAAMAAQQIGVSRQIYCYYENGHNRLHRIISADKARTLCEFLECDIVNLLNDELFRVPLENDDERAILIKNLYDQIQDQALKESVKKYVENEKEEN